jgi:hypothetical protein
MKIAKSKYLSYFESIYKELILSLNPGISDKLYVTNVAIGIIIIIVLIVFKLIYYNYNDNKYIILRINDL